MNATLTISAVNHIIVDESTGERWRIVPEDEFRRLTRSQEVGDTGNMKWFLSKVSMTEDTAKKKILYPFRKELESIVSYSDTRGKPWKFQKTRVSEWLEENWSRYA